jgi:hypothetical protein
MAESKYPDPGDPDIVAGILGRQRKLTREEWKKRLSSLPSSRYLSTISRRQRQSGFAKGILVVTCLGWGVALIATVVGKVLGWNKIVEDE